LSPRTDFERLERSRVLERVDDKPVWSLVCFFIHSEHQRKGIASALLNSAVEFVSKQGAPALESYPILEWGPKVTRGTAYTGTVKMFERAGFHKVSATKARSGGQPRVIMRRDLVS
jgi:GNAT superfamily N-acetyltransferase